MNHDEETRETIESFGRELFKGDAWGRWLDHESLYLRERPRDVLERGDYARVRSALEALAHGMFT